MATHCWRAALPTEARLRVLTNIANGYRTRKKPPAATRKTNTRQCQAGATISPSSNGMVSIAQEPCSLGRGGLFIIPALPTKLSSSQGYLSKNTLALISGKVDQNLQNYTRTNSQVRVGSKSLGCQRQLPPTCRLHLYLPDRGRGLPGDSCPEHLA